MRQRKTSDRQSVSKITLLTPQMLQANKLMTNINVRKAETFCSVLTLEEYDAETILTCLVNQLEDYNNLQANRREDDENWEETIKRYQFLIAEIEKGLEWCRESGEDEFTLSLKFWEMDILVSSLEMTRIEAEDDEWEGWEIGARIELEAIEDEIQSGYAQWKSLVSKKRSKKQHSQL
jgi:hypothetical protein